MTSQHLKFFRDLLGGTDMDVRIEAGENLALLHESRLILGLTGSGYPLGGGAETGREGGENAVGEIGVNGEGEDEDDDDGQAAEEAVDLTVLWEEVVEEMKGFITDSSKKVSFVKRHYQ